MPDADKCVCCGEIVPEGRQVCPQCESYDKENPRTEIMIKEV